MNVNLCRLCYEKDATINIFYYNSGQLFSKIRHCCRTVKLDKDDGLPPMVCNNCESELEACYHFLLKCEAADKKIRSLVCPNKTTCVENQDVLIPTIVTVKSENNFHDDFCHDAEELLESPSSEIKHDEIKLELVQPEYNLKDNQGKNKRGYKRRIKLNKEQLICSVCGKNCLSKSALAIHVRAHTDEKPYHCSYCDMKYKDSGNLKRHVERNHTQNRERKFICENCGKGFYSKYDIVTHMRVHTGETPYTCSICTARFTQLSAMLRHERRHTGTKSNVCSTCNKSFWTKTELKKHYSAHDDVRRFSCPICTVYFKHKGSFQKHMRMHSEPNRFVCHHCSKTFNQKGSLKSHMGRKHSEKAGHCSVCLKNVPNLEAHMLRHTGHRPFKCELCESSFYNLKSLTHHVNFKHKNTDRFKCTIEGCIKSFPSKPMLKFHVAKFHDQNPPHPCGRCSRSFYRKNDLARHMLGTHKERLL